MFELILCFKSEIRIMLVLCFDPKHLQLLRLRKAVRKCFVYLGEHEDVVYRPQITMLRHLPRLKLAWRLLIMLSNQRFCVWHWFWYYFWAGAFGVLTFMLQFSFVAAFHAQMIFSLFKLNFSQTFFLYYVVAKQTNIFQLSATLPDHL